MKITVKLFRIIALVAVIGFSFFACDDGTTNGGGFDKALNGTWVTVYNSIEIELAVNNGSWEMKVDGIQAQKGTYATNSNIITEIVTAYHGDYLEAVSNTGQKFESKWHTRADLKALGNNDAQLDQIFYTEIGTYIVTSTTLTITDSDGDQIVYTKKGNTGNGGGNAGTFKVVSTGGEQSVAIATDGSIWSWGENVYGELGNGTDGILTRKTIPTKIGPATDWASISTGNGHTLAIKTDGSLWAWGYNSQGQVGDGTTTDRNTPVRIGSDKDWKFVTAGNGFSLALKTDGSLWSWGRNDDGQLGNGSSGLFLIEKSPIRIGSEYNWKSVSAGGAFSLSIKTDGSLWSWGKNYNGELGHGEFGIFYNRNTPTRIGSDNNWASVDAGGSTSLAIKMDGSLWAWGDNQNGVLGDGTTTAKATPVRIGSDVNWAFISSGGDHSLAIKTDGSLWSWGYNSHGNLGDGTTTNKHSPVRVGSDNNWSSVDAGGHSLAIKTDGSLWAWGWNDRGKLGDGTTTNRHSPVRIGQ